MFTALKSIILVLCRYSKFLIKSDSWLLFNLILNQANCSKCFITYLNIITYKEGSLSQQENVAVCTAVANNGL